MIAFLSVQRIKYIDDLQEKTTVLVKKAKLQQAMHESLGFYALLNVVPVKECANLIPFYHPRFKW